MMASRSSSFRSPLSRARGLGSAKDGTAHWWAQRVTAVGLVPLVLWFAFSVVSLSTGDHAEVTAWLAEPWVAVLTMLLLLATFYHASLGCQVVIEDYIAHEGWRIAALVLVKLVLVALAIAGLFAVAKIAFGYGPTIE